MRKAIAIAALTSGISTSALAQSPAIWTYSISGDGSSTPFLLEYTSNAPLTSNFNETFTKFDLTYSISGKEVWVNFDDVIHNVSGGDMSSTVSNLVVRYIGGERDTDARNTPLLGAVIGLTDKTGDSASSAGTLQNLELDLNASGTDDVSGAGGGRRNLLIALGETPGGTSAPSATNAIVILSGSGSGGTNGLGYYVPISIQTPFRDTAFDTRGAGNMSGGSANAVWMAKGQHIALDNSGTGGADVVSLTSTGSALEIAPSLQIGSNTNAYLATDASSTVMTTGQPFRMPGYTVATLPTISPSNYGATAWATNCRNPGQGAGAGTGCLVTVNHVGSWIAVWSGTTPTT